VVRSKATVALVEVAGSIGDARLRGRRSTRPWYPGSAPPRVGTRSPSGRVAVLKRQLVAAPDLLVEVRAPILPVDALGRVGVQHAGSMSVRFGT